MELNAEKIKKMVSESFEKSTKKAELEKKKAELEKKIKSLNEAEVVGKEKDSDNIINLLDEKKFPVDKIIIVTFQGNTQLKLQKIEKDRFKVLDVSESTQIKKGDELEPTMGGNSQPGALQKGGISFFKIFREDMKEDMSFTLKIIDEKRVIFTDVKNLSKVTNGTEFLMSLSLHDLKPGMAISFEDTSGVAKETNLKYQTRPVISWSIY